MMSREEFSSAARAFMDELSMLCLRANSEQLARLPGFDDELAEVKDLVSRPDVSAPALLSSSFGLVDEFATKAWQHVISQAYESYTAAMAKDA